MNFLHLFVFVRQSFHLQQPFNPCSKIIWTPNKTLKSESVSDLHFLIKYRDFPGGPVVKNLPANAGDMGSTPGPGARIPHASGQLNLVHRNHWAGFPRARTGQQEKPPKWEACALATGEQPPFATTREKITCSNEHSAQPKINFLKKNSNLFLLFNSQTELAQYF